MDTTLEIVVTEEEYRVDSRLVAQSLGIEHESFMRTITTYQADIEELGLLRFEIGAVKNPEARGTKYLKYTMLNENQAIFLATLSRNTRQVVSFKLKLTKAFALARQQIPTPVEPSLNSLWDARARLFNEKTRIPAGYWCIFNEIAHVCWGMEFRGAHLREDAVPDISVGRLWCKYAREREMDMSEVRQYLHHYPDRRGAQYANIYPNTWLGAFRDWFQGYYLQQVFPEYLHEHGLTALSQTSARNSLPKAK